uniref:Uncharacterized protein n=1 Tax=Leersia perrieri TaxID=77586 RepID=A0A0D9WH63_9ORYZ
MESRQPEKLNAPILAQISDVSAEIAVVFSKSGHRHRRRFRSNPRSIAAAPRPSCNDVNYRVTDSCTSPCGWARRKPCCCYSRRTRDGREGCKEEELTGEVEGEVCGAWLPGAVVPSLVPLSSPMLTGRPEVKLHRGEIHRVLSSACSECVDEHCESGTGGYAVSSDSWPE